MFCANCGKKLNDDAKFCSECGSKTIYMIKTEAEVEEPAPDLPYQEVFHEMRPEQPKLSPVIIIGFVAAGLTIIVLLISLITSMNMVTKLNAQLKTLQNTVVMQQQEQQKLQQIIQLQNLDAGGAGAAEEPK